MILKHFVSLLWQTFDRCSSLGLAQSRQTYLNMLDDLDGGLVDHIRGKVQEGLKLRVTFDNFDFQVLANIIVKGHQNSDMHWITQFITFDRVPCNGLNDTFPIIRDMKDFENSNYLLSKQELQSQRNDYIVLVSRVLVEYFPCLKPIESVVPKHIAHQYSKEMATPSEIISLPVVPYNQNKLGDVCQYLSYLTEFLVKVLTPEPEDIPNPSNTSAAEVADHASQVLKDHCIPLAGDLLGRERVTGAKKTRAGCDYRTDRFDHIVETPAVWHAKQSFLCVSLCTAHSIYKGRK